MAELKMSESKEWLDEPDREDFEHAGYKCLVLRHDEVGHLCGYAAVPRGHPCYGKHYDHLPYEDLFTVDVHGGLTHSGEGDGKFWTAGYWWLGFDCAHAYDLVPFMEDFTKRFMGPSLGGTYRNFQYARQETKKLADEMAKLEFIDWQFTWVWPLLLPLGTAQRLWMKGRKNSREKGL